MSTTTIVYNNITLEPTEKPNEYPADINTINPTNNSDVNNNIFVIEIIKNNENNENIFNEKQKLKYYIENDLKKVCKNEQFFTKMFNAYFEFIKASDEIPIGVKNTDTTVLTTYKKKYITEFNNYVKSKQLTLDPSTEKPEGYPDNIEYTDDTNNNIFVKEILTYSDDKTYNREKIHSNILKLKYYIENDLKKYIEKNKITKNINGVNVDVTVDIDKKNNFNSLFNEYFNILMENNGLIGLTNEDVTNYMAKYKYPQSGGKTKKRRTNKHKKTKKNKPKKRKTNKK